MKKIIEKQKRSILNEGRNFGVGFSILKKVKSNFETLIAFTACKDYLNDIIYSETNNVEVSKIHGFYYEYQNLFKFKRFFYLGVKSLHYTYQNWKQFEECDNLIKTNYKNVEKVLNIIEDKLNLKTKTTVELDEETLIFKVPIYWSKSTQLISLYTLIIRCFINITDEQINNFDKIDLQYKCLIDADNFLFHNILKVLENPTLNYMEDITNKVHPHNIGIDFFFKKLSNETKT